MSATRRRRRSISIALATGLALAALIPGGAPALAQISPDEVVSHLLCYRGTFAPFEPVPGIGVEDEPWASDVTVRRPRLLCNPVRKTRPSGEVTRIVDRRQHLKAYTIRLFSTLELDLLDSNQFGVDQAITIRSHPSSLLVPTRKAPHERPEGLDHFLCHEVVQAEAIGKRVRLRDQFGTYRTRVGKPKLHCYPAYKTHPPAAEIPPVNTFAHLLCYGIEPRRLDPPVSRRTGNQFERRRRVRAEVAIMLCVPSTKVAV